MAFRLYLLTAFPGDCPPPFPFEPVWEEPTGEGPTEEGLTGEGAQSFSSKKEIFPKKTTSFPFFLNAITELSEEIGVAEFLREIGWNLPNECGGRGRCGKCQVWMAEIPAEAFPRALPDDRSEMAAFWAGLSFKSVLGCQTILRNDTVLLLPASKSGFVFEPVSDCRPRSNPDLSLDFDFGLEFNPKVASLRTGQSEVGPTLVGQSQVGDLQTDEKNDNFNPEEFEEFKGWGVAVDLGTTTLAVALVDLATQKVLQTQSVWNPQAVFGQDVISRIAAAQSSKTRKILQQQVVQTIQETVEALASRESRSSFEREYRKIRRVTIAGNTVMQFLLLGRDPAPLGGCPFMPTPQAFEPILATTLGLRFHPDALVRLFPAFSGFVGGDITSGVLTLLERSDCWSGICEKKSQLFLDIGTNGEMVLILPDRTSIGSSSLTADVAKTSDRTDPLAEGVGAAKPRFFTTSTATGPAFEGAEIEFGMRGTRGAIDTVDFSQEPLFHVLGQETPLGICGSGMIDAVAELLNAGILQPNGRFRRSVTPEISKVIRTENRAEIQTKDKTEGQTSKFPAIQKYHGKWAFPFLRQNEESFNRQTPGKSNQNDQMFEETCENQPPNGTVWLTQKDVRQIQLAVGAVRTGIRLLLREARLSIRDLDRLYVAGGFGNAINREKAQRMGLLPKEIPPEKIVYCGNASLKGAVRALAFDDNQWESLMALVRRGTSVDLATHQYFQDEFVESLIFPES